MMLPPHAWKHRVALYGLAVLLVVLTEIMREGVLVPFAQHPLFIVFMLPVLISAFLGGMGPGLVATAVASVATAYAMLSLPPMQVSGTNYSVLHWLMLPLNGTLISVMSGFLHRARQREAEKWQRLLVAEKQLQRSDARFQNIFEQAAIGIALVSPEGRWLMVNDRLCAITGYSREELLTRNFRDITHPDDLPADQALTRSVLDGEQGCYVQEKRYLHKTRGPTWVRLSVSLARTPEGVPDYFIAIVEDTQAIKQAETLLQSKDQALREAQQLARVGSWTWHPQTDTPQWSDMLYQIFGRDRALPAANYAEAPRYYTVESWARLSAAVRQTLQDGQPYTCDAEIVREDGSHGWVLARGEAVLDADGHIAQLRGTVQDISERKQAELALLRVQIQALEEQRQGRLAALNLMEDALAARARTEAALVALSESEQRLRMAQEGAHVGIWELDLLTNQVYWSPECARIYGVEPGAPRDNDEWRAHVHADDLPQIDAQWQNMSRHEPFEVEFRYRLDSGDTRWLMTKGGAQYDESGRPVRLSGINQDITARKQAEEKLLRQTDELRLRNAELERFNRVMVGRELDMIELKKHINRLAGELGRTPPYPLDFLAASPPPQGASS